MRWTRRRAASTPALSVVVPVFNVAPWLAACLDSILRQPVDGLQVVVADDGSTDGSGDIADDYAARNPGVECFHQENSGVSIARNNAIRRCHGDLLTFVDPDDELPVDAWSSMVTSLREGGSDFVVGSAERLDHGRRYVTPLMKRNHEVERLGIRIEDQPLMLADVFVWNKIFRRSFWDATGITFPERTRYQDQPAMTKAFLAAGGFDVLTEVVYDWAVRPSYGSATQRRRDLTNLRERMTTKLMTVDLVRAHGSDEVSRVLFAEVLPIDMWEHFRSVPGSDDDYWRVLRDGVRDIWGTHSLPFERTSVPVQQRLMGWLVAQDRRGDLEHLVHFLDSHDQPPIVDGELRHPWYDDASLPREVTTAAVPA